MRRVAAAARVRPPNKIQLVVGNSARTASPASISCEPRPGARQQAAEIEGRDRRVALVGRRGARQHPAAEHPASRVEIGGGRGFRCRRIAGRGGQHPLRRARQGVGAGGEPRIGGARLGDEAPHRFAAVARHLAHHQVDRLDAVGALVDRRDADVAQHLRGAGLLHEAHAAMHLDAERGAIHAAIRAPRLDDRGQQRDPRLGLRVAGHAEPVQRRARLQRQQPAGEGDGADLRQHPRHVRVSGDRTAALHPLRRIGLGERQRPRALRHALHADAQARRVHHGEHGVEAAIRLADQLRLGAVEQHDAGGRGVDAELALDAAAAQRVALPVRQHLRRGEERDAARPWRRVRQPREHEVQRVLRQVVLAPGDVDLLAVQPVAAVTRRLGAGADLRKVAARLRLGQAHGAGPLAGDEPRQPRLGLLRRRVALQRLDRAGGEQGAGG